MRVKGAGEESADGAIAEEDIFASVFFGQDEEALVHAVQQFLIAHDLHLHSVVKLRRV